ncbi:short-chain dehydrogenase/reductase SDR [Desulfonatronospira thiodismutans ASO3-1]|uniref:Short-chain dehydrogenase/reductase SDR n=1 Tax=Desulfonatronospira thiodismutans ASO3-1 TaxID=555779 RepID=D6SS16_9BACT|nr:3-oxoacyl-ACP reductase FabG [Desulfonatronospira thiodismutans]EFI33482.1 short-chain dehydrogenase/reductase SDR [Desulfonatronospira thiodismutans ASO3-1]
MHAQNKPRTALVTGGSRGIGAATAIMLARDGFDIWLNYRSNHQKASVVKDSIEILGRKCQLLPFDVADPEAAFLALEPVLEKETPFAVINNAGYAADKLMLTMDYHDDWRKVLDVHLDGFFLVTKLALEKMLRKRSGRIVNIVSTAGQSGMPGQTNYAAAKSGLIGATKSLAQEMGKRNILVNAVAPGFIETDMTTDLPWKEMLPRVPLNRIGQPEEVAGAVSFLCSDKASYITGQVIAVNGGIYM